MAATQTDQKKLLEPKEPLVTVSRNKPANFFVYIAKIHLKKFETIELRALGNAAEVSVQVAENLSRYKFAEITKINSETIEMKNRDDKLVKAIRFSVTLKRSKDFDALVGNSLK